MSRGSSCGAHHHEHEHEPFERGREYSLFAKINKEQLDCLNESEEGSAAGVFKPWDDRLDTDKFVESDVDEELLFRIPFTGDIKLKGFIVIGGEGNSHPSEVRLYKNRPGMTFEDTVAEPDETFQLYEDRNGTTEYATRVSKFSSLTHLCLHFSRNFGADTTKIYYIGFRGEFSESHRHEVTICNYEARANPADHKNETLDSVGHQIS
ncbi:PITH domain-containing protein 1-like [Corticium candelabrum]|uniref:PITH domain-containing protein 1-like n=1 Tax=Corticium candelabrum TaxID=121492 RepID=UPI002E361F80|nr:PITH domain-containing protein 1-like [Corticium candelabrum]